MKNNIEYLSPGIYFTSFIALNRYMDRNMLRDPKLFTLMVYIALRVKRSEKVEQLNWDGLKLNIGEFVIGRHTATSDTGLTDAEYRTRLKKLQTLKIIGNLQSTNKYTKGTWLENSFIDVNLEIPTNQPNNQQTSNGLTTNNNVNNSNNPMFVIVNSINNSTYSTGNYIRVITAYTQYKGIELRGEEIKDTFRVVKKMFDSQRTPSQIIDCMKWLHKNENSEFYKWTSNWTIRTVQLKMPEFLAGKLKARTWEDDIPEYK